MGPAIGSGRRHPDVSLISKSIGGWGRRRHVFTVEASAHRGAGARAVWRRWTGIEPAGQGSPIPPALKAGEPTRRSDTSVEDPIGAPSSCRDERSRERNGGDLRIPNGVVTVPAMSKNRILLIAVLVALLSVLSRKVRDV